jgi:hypothetical protein
MHSFPRRESFFWGFVAFNECIVFPKESASFGVSLHSTQALALAEISRTLADVP